MSAKTSSQGGRRTPLSLSGAGSKTAGSKSANVSNGLSQSPSSKAENKKSQQQQQQQQQQQHQLQQQVSNNIIEIKDSAQQPAAVSNRRQSSCSTDSGKKVEKTQNGMGNISQNAAAATAAGGNKDKLQPPQQQQQQSQPTTNNDNKLNASVNTKEKEKEKHVKTDKSEKKDKIEKVEKMEKISRSEVKGKEKMEKKSKEENIANAAAHPTAKSQNKGVETKISQELNAAAEEAFNKNEVKKEEEKKEEEEQMPTTPKTPKEERKLATTTKSPSKVTAAQAKAKGEKTPSQKKKLTQDSKPMQKPLPAAVIVNNEAAAIIPAESMEMEAVVVIDDSPIKTQMEDLKPTPSATSTPDKGALANKRIMKTTTAPSMNSNMNSEKQLTMQSGYFTERPRNLAQITGRRSIRPITEYTPSRHQFDSQYRESYRRTNTDFDDTCSSTNVTVGSEVHNNSSFSFFSRGRKRTSPLQPTDTVMESPAKKARLDFCSVLLSPITMLRNRFSRTTIQSSTPLKIKAKTQATTEEENDNGEVQNVSGVAMQDDFLPAAEVAAINDINEIDEPDNTLGEEHVVQTSNTVIDEDGNDDTETKDTSDLATQKSYSFEYQQQPQQPLSEDSDKEIKEKAGTNKKERCILM